MICGEIVARRRAVRLPCLAVVLGIALAPQWANAESTVYKGTDPAGRTVYSDRPASTGSKPVPNRVSPEPSAARYDEAVMRAESARISVQRSYLEDRLPRKIAVYDPRGSVETGPVSLRRPDPHYRPRARWDPNLPDSPAPSLERNYRYDGR